jgi:hypothetical protein
MSILLDYVMDVMWDVWCYVEECVVAKMLKYYN